MAKPSKTEHFTGPEARALVGKRVTFILNPLFLNILDVPAGAIGRIVSNHQHPHGGWCVQVVFSSVRQSDSPANSPWLSPV